MKGNTSILWLLLLFAGALAAESMPATDFCQTAAQLADANNKYLRQMSEEGFLTVDKLDRYMGERENETNLAVGQSGQLCTAAAARMDEEFTWLKIENLAVIAGGILAVIIIWERAARKAFGIIRPTENPLVLLINGARMIREDFYKAEVKAEKEANVKLKAEVEQLKAPKPVEAPAAAVKPAMAPLKPFELLLIGAVALCAIGAVAYMLLQGGA